MDAFNQQKYSDESAELFYSLTFSCDGHHLYTTNTEGMVIAWCRRDQQRMKLPMFYSFLSTYAAGWKSGDYTHLLLYNLQKPLQKLFTFLEWNEACMNHIKRPVPQGMRIPASDRACVLKVNAL